MIAARVAAAGVSRNFGSGGATGIDTGQPVPPVIGRPVVCNWRCMLLAWRGERRLRRLARMQGLRVAKVAGTATSCRQSGELLL